ncbi:MAG: hypothetical protein ACK55Z_11505, partial [bacterium]
SGTFGRMCSIKRRRKEKGQKIKLRSLAWTSFLSYTSKVSRRPAEFVSVVDLQYLYYKTVRLCGLDEVQKSDSE